MPKCVETDGPDLFVVPISTKTFEEEYGLQVGVAGLVRMGDGLNSGFAADVDDLTLSAGIRPLWTPN